MTVRLKILALSTALLAILCAALFVSLRLQREVHDEIASVTVYHLPLSAMLGEAESALLDYQLNLGRLMREGGDAEAAATTLGRERVIIEGMRAGFDRAEALLERAISDPINDLSDRLVLARVRGALQILRREVDPVEAAGARVLASWAAGERDAAFVLLGDFVRHEELFKTDITALRADLSGLAAAATQEVLAHQESARALSILLFIAAAIVGLVLATVMATRLVGGLRRLVAGARAVEAGGTASPLPITSRDEVGELTRAFNHMVSELAAKQRIRDTFGKFVDPKIVASLIDATGGQVERAERRVATVFFSDIAGFSALSEQLTASAVANLLNRWFTLSTEAIRAHHGVLDKYIGDSVMAFWAPPFVAAEEQAAQACLAALAQRDAVATLRAELPELLGLRRQVPRFGVRMGLATGELVLGTIGSPTAKSYTAIGDVVNLASRLEGINKIYGTSIVASEETVRLARGAVEARELDTIVVGGKTEPVRVFEIVAAAGQLAATGERLGEIWAEALDRYRARDWRAARSAIAGCLELAPQDGPAQVLRDRLERLEAEPPSGDWDGVWRMAKM